ncbi:MAG: nucleotidyltransferase domain-containing protein [Polaromonas sp.]|nr:nucleotidyltransferase domain-containing protein [Polaromonas sp.]
MSAADFLFTPSMQRVLAQVFVEPEQSFTLNELLVQAGGGRGGGQKQIERLLASGVLQEGPRRARQRSIKVNTGFFLYPELRGIVLKSFGLAEPLRSALKPFETQIDEAFVFGSVAKGTDTHNSDIDLIVVGDAPLMAMTDAMLEAGKSLGREVHLNLYGSDEWAKLKQVDPVLAQISEASKIRIFPHATPH